MTDAMFTTANAIFTMPLDMLKRQYKAVTDDCRDMMITKKGRFFGSKTEPMPPMNFSDVITEMSKYNKSNSHAVPSSPPGCTDKVGNVLPISFLKNVNEWSVVPKYKFNGDKIIFYDEYSDTQYSQFVIDVNQEILRQTHNPQPPPPSTRARNGGKKLRHSRKRYRTRRR